MAGKEIKKPNFFIVGAPKCGTTAMYEYLRHHPEIFMPRRTKEPSFFGTDLVSSRYIRNLDQYLALFAEVTNEKMVGDASPGYLFSKISAQEIKQFCPHAKIIIMLRNPVDMMYSLHSQYLYDYFEDIQDFEEALKAEIERKKGKRIPKADYPTQFLYYRDMARYSQQVKRYLETFGRENVHIIIFDDFKQDTKKVYSETLKFLGVHDFLLQFRIVNSNKRSRSKRLRYYVENPPSSVVFVARTLLPQVCRDKLYELFRRVNTKYFDRPPMDFSLRKQLLIEFESEIENLGILIGRDLSFWNEQSN